MGVLRDRMVREMSLREFSASTQKLYLTTLTDLATYHHRSPDTLDPTQVQDFLLYLTQERHLAWSSVSVAASAIRILLPAGVEAARPRDGDAPASEATTPAAHPERRGGRAGALQLAPPHTPGAPDDHLRRGPTGQRGRAAPAHGSLHHPVPTPAHGSGPLPRATVAHPLALSGPHG